MPQSWKITAYAPRTTIEAALLSHEDVLDWDPEIVLAGSELADDRPEEWRLEAWLPRKPRKADKAAVAALFAGGAPEFEIEKLPENDWVTQSQQGLEPIRAGRFHVHTPDHPSLALPDVTDFVIPASQAFGTGQHATTAGCLAMLTEMKRCGIVIRNLADVGTGSGLLAFAALDLWPRALATASDIDPVCIGVVEDNARLNGVAMGARPGELTMLAADGMGHPLIEARGPYDLVIANILAGPLVALAPEFARALVPGGHLLLSGLLETQEAQVRRACRRAGLRLAARLVKGDWSVLWLRKRISR
ncbi:MAG: 50S ribosomal protein L11 methyltransferase [Novosphingobium sp.]|nr:50S ribosomal protein L11 methyltransferase [Novosphingobium sp.]